MTPADRTRGATVAAAVLVLVWLAAIGFRIAGPRTVLPVDGWCNAAVAAVRSPALRAAAGLLAWIGTGWPAVAASALAVAAIALATRRWRSAAFVAATGLVSVGDTALMKQVAGRIRPDPAHFAAATAFPSGHTANAAALAVAVALVLHRRAVWVVAVGYVAAMAASRTYLHAHWISDVVAGAAAGAATAALLWPVARPGHGAAGPAVPGPTAAAWSG